MAVANACGSKCLFWLKIDKKQPKLLKIRQWIEDSPSNDIFFILFWLPNSRKKLILLINHKPDHKPGNECYKMFTYPGCRCQTDSNFSSQPLNWSLFACPRPYYVVSSIPLYDYFQCVNMITVHEVSPAQAVLTTTTITWKFHSVNINDHSVKFTHIFTVIYRAYD